VKVLIVTHFYPPEPAAAANRVASLVTALSAAGNDVTVVTNFPSFPRGRFAEGARPFQRVEESGRTRVVRLWSWLPQKLPGARLLHWLTAALSASAYATFTRERYDVVLISAPPITLALPAIVASLRHRAKLVVDVRDVFPDIAIAMGAWKKDALLTRCVEFVARTLYRRASLVVAVTPTAIAQIAERGIPASRLMLARNAAERSDVVRPPARDENGFVAIYAGNLGLATDVDVLLDAAGLLAEDCIKIEIVGDGAQRARLDERVRNESLRNVVVRGSVPRLDAMAMVARADVCVIPLRKGIEESVPTKLYDALAVGCPVVVAAAGEARREGESLGMPCTPPGDAQALAATLRQLAELEDNALRRLGESGRNRVEGRADRAGIMDELVGRIAALA